MNKFWYYINGKVDIKRHKEFLPTGITIQYENDGMELIHETTDSASQSEYFVKRELDRLSFLSGVDLEINKTREKKENSAITTKMSLSMDAVFVKAIPSNLIIQVWDHRLAEQLRYWNEANARDMVSKIKHYFAIIECEYPETSDQKFYPIYNDNLKPPNRYTEAKLMRDLASHTKGEVNSAQLKTYCKFLGYPESFLDITDRKYLDAVKGRLHIIVELAREILNKKISVL